MSTLFLPAILLLANVAPVAGATGMVSATILEPVLVSANMTSPSAAAPARVRQVNPADRRELDRKAARTWPVMIEFE